MVSGKRKYASSVFDEKPFNKLRKTGQQYRMISKEQKLAMFMRPKPIIPLDMLDLGVLERLLNFLDVVTAISLHFLILVLNSFYSGWVLV